MKIYLIEDNIGDCEDNRTSVIKAFKDKEQAEAYCIKYNDLLEKLRAHTRSMYDLIEYWDSCFNYKVNEYGQCRLIEIELI